MKKIFSSLIIAGVFIGCSNNVDLKEYPSNIRNPINVPEVCKQEYKELLNPPRVAIMRFNNNTNFGVAKVSNNSSSYEGGAALGISAFGIGAHAHQDKNKNIVNRVVEPKLDKAITSAFEGVLVSMGGVNVYSRDDLQKILKEQKLQQNGLFQENSLAKLGQLVGVDYIITGSIDKVTQDSKDYTSIAKMASMILLQSNADAKQKAVGIAGANLAAKALSGTKITTTITFKVLDVVTGKILFSKQITQEKNIGEAKNPSYSQIIGAIKTNIINALEEVKPEFSEFFAPKGYILQLKSDKKHKNFIAQINLGSKDEIKAGQIFRIYQLSEFIDPITHKRTCDKSFMDAKIIISDNQINDYRAWGIIEGEEAQKVRAGNIIKRDKLNN